MTKYKQVNIDIPEDIWKEFGMLCIQLDQTRKETMAQALQSYIDINKSNKNRQNRGHNYENPMVSGEE